MTKLLEEAIAAVEQLRPEEQDNLAALLLAEIEDERRWEDSFRRNPQKLRSLADKALDALHRGETLPLDVDKI